MTPRPAQPKHDARSIRECNHLSLVRRNRMINRVFILEIVQPGNGEATFGRLGPMGGVCQGATF